MFGGMGWMAWVYQVHAACMYTVHGVYVHCNNNGIDAPTYLEKVCVGLCSLLCGGKLAGQMGQQGLV